MIVHNLEDCQYRAGDLFDHHFTAGAGDENQSHAALQPASPLPFSFARERVIMARSADESLHVFGRLHLCKPTEKYVCTPLAVLLSGCRLRGADLLQLAIGEADFHSRGRGIPYEFPLAGRNIMSNSFPDFDTLTPNVLSGEISM